MSLRIHCTITYTLPLEYPADEPQTNLVKRFLHIDMDIQASNQTTILPTRTKPDERTRIPG
jgi:hypothetical protein